jgi:hypothetical protein
MNKGKDHLYKKSVNSFHMLQLEFQFKVFFFVCQLHSKQSSNIYIDHEIELIYFIKGKKTQTKRTKIFEILKCLCC